MTEVYVVSDICGPQGVFSTVPAARAFVEARSAATYSIEAWVVDSDKKDVPRFVAMYTGRQNPAGEWEYEWEV
jgi:hypothetical protein